MKFENYLESLELGNRTIQTHSRTLKMYLNWLDVEGLNVHEVSSNDLLAFIQSLTGKGLKQRTIQHYMGSVKHYYDFQIRQEKVVSNPVNAIEIKGVKRSTLYQIIESKELKRLYQSYPTPRPIDCRNKVILSLLVFQGLRTAELGKLEVSDVNLEEGIISITGSRNSTSRQLTLEPIQILPMSEYIDRIRPKILELPLKRKSQIKKPTSTLFIGQGGSTSSFSNIRYQVMQEVKRINGRITSANQIRASVITNWFRVNNLREVQYMAGHRYISSTEAYLVNDLEGLSEEVGRFHPLG